MSSTARNSTKETETKKWVIMGSRHSPHIGQFFLGEKITLTSCPGNYTHSPKHLKNHVAVELNF